MLNNPMPFYIFLKKVKELNLEILPNDKRHTFFLFYYKFYLIIQKKKGKFVVDENKYMCGYCKIIWISNPKCNTHIQVHFNITHKWFR
jgi:hypothetical protein